jgi:hypothetical protein
MTRHTKDETINAEKLSPRMEEFFNRVIEEVEEAGIDDEYAEEEAEPKPAARVAQSTVYARRHRR